MFKDESGEYKFYDQGWNARIEGKAYQNKSTKDWRDGWKDCDGANEEDRKPI